MDTYYNFDVCGLKFKVALVTSLLQFDDTFNLYVVTNAYARFENPTKLYVTTAVKHPKDTHNLYIGNKVALHKLFNGLYAHVCPISIKQAFPRKSFVAKCFKQAQSYKLVLGGH